MYVKEMIVKKLLKANSKDSISNKARSMKMKFYEFLFHKNQNFDKNFETARRRKRDDKITAMG